jgi:Carboxypeptidase regulatory-like domain/TonB-dependent Receptor Plug Domain/TonB dependent receptor
MVSRCAAKLFALFALLLLAATGVRAQSIVTGAVRGTITDPSDAVVPSATATLKNAATGDTQTATTNTSGVYLFPLLRPGNYAITVQETGFRRAIINVTVALGQTATADLKLELGDTTLSVEVTAGGVEVQAEDGNISSNFDTRQVENVPNPGGDITYIAQVSPGVTMNTSSGGGFGNFSAFGLPGTANLFTINGNDYNDPFLNLNNSGASNLLLGANEVEEVTVVSNAYTGQYGRQAGAQIDYNTKSGSNSFHGDASYYWTGRALSANDFFNNANSTPRPFENNNQWAAAFGGPIKRDKAFFFANTEGIRYTFGTSTQVFVPSPALQNFVLSTSLPANNPTGIPFYQRIFALYNAAPGVNRATPVSNSCGSLGAIPTTRSTACLDSFRSAVTNGNREWLLTTRVDYNFNDNDKVFVRFKNDRGFQPTFTDSINPIFNIQSNQPQDEGQLNYTHIFSPKLVNSFVGSVLWYSAIFQSANQQAALNVFPVVLAVGDTNMTALGPGGNDVAANFFFPQGRNVTQWQLVDDLSIQSGNHTLKVGVNFRRDDVSDFTAGELNFPFLNATMANFVNGFVGTAASPGEVLQQFALRAQQPLALYSLGAYFQDQFRVTQRLKLTLALRADRNSGGICQSGCASHAVNPFNFLQHSATVPYNQMVTVGSQILPDIEKVVFQPRIGFAYSPWGDKTVFRGGVGLFSDLYPGTLLNLFTRNVPVVTTFSLTTGAVSPASPNSAASLIAACNSAFQSNFNAGGTVGSFLSLAPPGCQPPNLNDVTSQLRNPKYVEWNFEVEHRLSSKTVVSANYVGNKGYDELVEFPYSNAFGFGGLPASPIDTRVKSVTQLTNTGVSNYNGVTLSLQQQVAHGLSGRFNYSYARALDDISNGGILPYSLTNSIVNQISPFSLRSLNYSNADYDLRHSLSASYVWDLPFRANNGLVNRAIAGWEVSGTFFYHTGFPFSVVDGTSTLANQGNNMQFLTVLASPTSTVPKQCGSRAVTTPCFTASQYVPAGSATSFGTVPRNSFRGPGFFNTDLSLRKNFYFRERYGFMLGANAYNILNHVNFANPVANLSAGSSFGTILSTVNPPTSPYGSFAAAAVDARIVQVIAKLTF